LDSAGDQAKARAIDAQARTAAEAALKEQPNNPFLLFCRAIALAGLGDRAAALEGFDRCIALQAEDALEKGSIEEAKARALAHFGQKDEAIALLQHLLSISYNLPVTPALLRLDPDWDNPLRSDPRFQRLCEE
jgi:tetratricopeptide (TPR) repeat protein